MKRIISILLIIALVLSLSGCTRAKPISDDKDTSKPTVILPDISTASNVNGYKQPEITNPEDKNENTDKTNSPETDNISAAYIANTSSKKFHKSTCSYAKSIKAENLATVESREQLINDGYSPCKHCNP